MSVQPINFSGTVIQNTILNAVEQFHLKQKFNEILTKAKPLLQFLYSGASETKTVF